MFRIGEFSKIAQVSGRLLRYYEEIGLFSPIYSEPETGYRYYSAQQLPRLNRILALKELGLTLDQIACLLEDNISQDELRGMLTMRKAQVEQALHEEMVRLRTIEARIQGIDAQHDGYDVVVKSVPAQKFLALRKIYPSLLSAQHFSTTLREMLPTHVGGNYLSYFTVVLHSDVYELENIDIEMGFLLNNDIDDPTTLPDDLMMTVCELSAVATMATVIRIGSIERAHLSYGTIGLWAEANHYQLAGAAREVYIQPPIPGKAEDTVVEIQFPIQQQRLVS